MNKTVQALVLTALSCAIALSMAHAATTPPASPAATSSPEALYQAVHDEGVFSYMTRLVVEQITGLFTNGLSGIIGDYKTFLRGVNDKLVTITGVDIARFFHFVSDSFAKLIVWIRSLLGST